MNGEFLAKLTAGAIRVIIAPLLLNLTECRPIQMESFDRLTGHFSDEFGVAEIDATALRTRLAANLPTLLIDARTYAEQSVSIVPGARRVSPEDDLNLDPVLRDFAARTAGQPQAMVVVYCAGGYRSARSLAKYETPAGLAVRNLRGGIIAYANAGGELEDPASGQRTRRVHGYNAFWAGFIAAPNEAALTPPARTGGTSAP